MAAAALTAALVTPAVATQSAPAHTLPAPQTDFTCQRINGDEPNIEALGCRPPLEDVVDDVTIHGPRRTFFCQQAFPGESPGQIVGRDCTQVG